MKQNQKEEKKNSANRNELLFLSSFIVLFNRFNIKVQQRKAELDSK
jgi:hypothetical protein